MAVNEGFRVMRVNRPKVLEIMSYDYISNFDLGRYINEVNALLDRPAQVGDISVDKKLKIWNYTNFLKQLKKTFSGCSFAIKRDPAAKSEADIYTTATDRIRSWSEWSPRIFIYLPSNRNVSGWVSFGDFRKVIDGNNIVPKIAVWSPHITNRVIGRGDMQHALKTSSIASTALSTAKRYFKDEDMTAVALALVEQPSYAAYDYDNSLGELVSDAKEAFYRSDAFAGGMAQLAASGYTFEDIDLQEKLQTYVTEMEYHAENRLVGDRALMYVRGYVRGGVQMFDRVKLVRSAGITNADALGACTEEALSGEVKRQLSTLMMGDDGSFVAGVGYKLDQEVYYVYI